MGQSSHPASFAVWNEGMGLRYRVRVFIGQGLRFDVLGFEVCKFKVWE